MGAGFLGRGTGRLLVLALCMIGILLLALSIRLQPLKYGIYLYEYDPYFMLYTTKYIIDNGPLSWFELTKENVKNFWYPTGRDVVMTEYPGVPFFGYIAYNIVRPLLPDMPENTLLVLVADILPPIFGLITVVFAYLVAAELRDWRTGLLAALFTAISPAAIDRTIAGFYTKLGFGVAIYMVSLYFLVRALKRKSVLSSILSGVFLALIGYTWGGINFAILSYSVMLGVLVLLNLNDKDVAKVFTLTLATGLALLVVYPKFGIRFLIGSLGLLAVASLVLAYIDLYLRRTRISSLKRMIIVFLLVTLSIGGFLAAAMTGIVKVPSRQLSILFPWIRSENVVFISVAEHHPPSWDYMFMALSVSFILSPLGAYLLVRSRRVYDVVVLLPAVGALYGASSAAYLMTLAGPLVSVLGAVGLARILEVLGGELAKVEVKSKKRGREYVYIAKRLVLVATVLLGLVVGLLAPSTVRAGDQVPTILSSGVPYKVINRAWLKALDYMRENLPDDAVVATWWDYGYWVTVIGNKTSIADNATINATQISTLARVLMSNETVAARILLNELKTPPNSTYVVAYEAFQLLRMGNASYLLLLSTADVAKSYWMVRIGGLNLTDFFSRERGGIDWSSESVRSALLYNIIWESADRVGRELGYMPAVMISTPQGPAAMPMVPSMSYSGLSIFTPEYIAWDRSIVGRTSIVVIVGIFKLNATALGPG